LSKGEDTGVNKEAGKICLQESINNLKLKGEKERRGVKNFVKL